MPRVASGSFPECHGSDLGQNGRVTGRTLVTTGATQIGSGSERECHRPDLGQNGVRRGLDLGQNGGKNQHTPVGKNQAPNLTFPMTLYSSGSVKKTSISLEKRPSAKSRIANCAAMKVNSPVRT